MQGVYKCIDIENDYLIVKKQLNKRYTIYEYYMHSDSKEVLIRNATEQEVREFLELNARI
jgi:hypothetical protein